MSYKRKTQDEWQLHVYYGGDNGWEHEISELTRSEIKARQQEYDDNFPQYPNKVVCKRVPLNTFETTWQDPTWRDGR